MLSTSSERAEAVVRRLNVALALLSGSIGAGSHDGQARTALTPEQRDLRALLYPLALGLAEQFASEQLIDLARPVVEDSAPLTQTFWPAAQKDALANWESIFGAWKRWFNVDVRKFPRHADLLAHIQARNALVHGVGKLSQRQLRNLSEVTVQLASVGIEIRDGTLVLSSASFQGLVDVVLDFVLRLDEAAQEISGSS